MTMNLGPRFESAMIAAANLENANIEPGTIRIDEMNAEMVTVRFTVIRAVKRTTVLQLAKEALMGGVA